MAHTRFVSDKHLTFDSDLDLGCRDLNFKRDTTPFLLYLSLIFYKIPFIGFLFMADTSFVSDKPMTFDCDLDLGNLLILLYLL